MFFKPLSKCSSCLSYVLLITFQPITFVSINYTTLFSDVVFAFWCYQFIFYGFSTLEVNLYAISFTDVLEGFTESFIVRNSYVAFAYGLIVFVAVVVISWSTCLDFHSVYSNITGHSTTLDYFSIVGREKQNLSRLIKESMFIRVNNPSLNRNIGKYHLPHIWDEVLVNNTELKLK